MVEVVNPSDDKSLRDAAKEELLQLIDDLLYTEKTHLASAERLQHVHRRWGVAAAVMSTVAAATIVAELSPLVAGLLALGAAIVSGVLAFMKPESVAEQHLGVGRQLGALRVRARHVLNLDLPHLPMAEIRQAITDLTTEKAAVDGASPGTTSRDFEVARKKIKSGTFVRDQ